jgi:hypothetical protein
MTRSAARMHAAHLDPVVDDLQALPAAIRTPILVAWNAEEDPLDLLAVARTHRDRAAIRARLFRFYERCGASGPPELEQSVDNPHQRPPQPAPHQFTTLMARQDAMTRHQSARSARGRLVPSEFKADGVGL